ncbi:MAG: molybdopterin-synthase adenylyltransferase MoeB [Gammaproteobacteria bacterium]|nr:molybdopterin-synthase adenylyltransferase MoeB [Gammaproteobacteria bacterium]
MNDDQLLRYSRQILLPKFGAEGQQSLLDARVLIVGLGGLGSPVAMYLAAAGVGHLVLSDFDTVDLSNLQRQLSHGMTDIGRPKVESARDTLLGLNPEIEVTALGQRLEGEALNEQVRLADAVVDASDNFATRYLLNEACVQAATPLISGAAIRMEGQVTVYRNRDGGPCYRCLYRDGEESEETCSDNGVMAPLVGMVGSIQAMETIKLLSGMGEVLDGKLLIIDAMDMEFRSLRLRPDPTCPVCGGKG